MESDRDEVKREEKGAVIALCVFAAARPVVDRIFAVYLNFALQNQKDVEFSHPSYNKIILQLKIN